MNWVSIDLGNACRLFRIKPLPEPIVNWTPRNKLQWNSKQNTKLLIHENASENVICQIGSHFVQGGWGNCIMWYRQVSVLPVDKQHYFHAEKWHNIYHKTSNIRCTLVGNEIVDHSDVVGASPVGAAPTTSSFSTQHLASRDSAKTAVRQYENILSVGIWCVLY